MFKPEQFTPTQWDTREGKAKFANHFQKFVLSGFQRQLFPKWFYIRLSMTFGHIAHYDHDGFYSTWFRTSKDRVQFLEWTVNSRYAGIGDPAYTYSDVEKALAAWVRQSGLITQWHACLAEETEQTERGQLARLLMKYPQ